MTVQIIRGNALALGLADASVDLIVTSPPYFGLRSYQDGGEHYAGQIGDEPTPAEFVDALIAATAEMVRVLKPSGSIWVNLGDKYNSAASGQQSSLAEWSEVNARGGGAKPARATPGRGRTVTGVRTKSLIGIPWRYAIRCIDDLGLILRAEVIWAKPNGLPESVTDRVRRSHEVWFHFTKEPRYYSAVDEIREQQATVVTASGAVRYRKPGEDVTQNRQHIKDDKYLGEGMRGGHNGAPANPLGKLPGSVWTVATEPLHVPESLGIDHFAAFPTEFPRRIIQGWSPSGICTECGEGRRPVVDKRFEQTSGYGTGKQQRRITERDGGDTAGFNGDGMIGRTVATITGEACACVRCIDVTKYPNGWLRCTLPMGHDGMHAVDFDDPGVTPATRPAVVLDPFGGTGTTALVAHALGRHGISNDMSADYCRLAGWRTTDPKQIAKAARREYKPSAEKIDGQLDLLEGIA